MGFPKLFVELATHLDDFRLHELQVESYIPWEGWSSNNRLD